MKYVKIAEAKAHLSKHLGYVKRGGRIRILDRDNPVADIVPIVADGEGDDDEALLSQLERNGVLTRGKRGPIPRDLLQPGPADPQGLVLAALLAERDAGK